MKAPSTFKYIFVWILWITIYSITVFLLHLSFTLVFPDCSVFYNIFIIVVNYAVGCLMFIYIYKNFPDLKISKVMIYLWIFGFIGMASVVNEISDLLYNGCNLKDEYYGPYLIIASASSYIIHNLIIRYYFKNKPQWEGKLI